MADQQGQKKLTIQDIARISGLSTATVDRVLNNRPGVRKSTRLRVEEALKQPLLPEPPETKHIAFVIDAGTSFIDIVHTALNNVQAHYPHITFTFDSVPSSQRDQHTFCQLLTARIADSDGIVLVSREDVLVNSVVREARLENVPIVCLTSDLPHSAACIGPDEVSTGANAAWFMGRMLPPQPARVLFVASTTYRAQEEREMGFRRVMRSEFPHLDMIEKINANDESAETYQIMKEVLAQNANVAGIYNLAGGNRGIARALREAGLSGKTIFIGHELTEHTQKLLERGEMDIVFAHDMEREIRDCICTIEDLLQGKTVTRSFCHSLMYTQHSRF